MINIASEVKRNLPGVDLHTIIIKGVSVKKIHPSIKKYKKYILRKLRNEYSIENLNENNMILAYRNLYRDIGLDPIINPPSVENLIKRYLLKNYFPNINTVVDACNLVAIDTLVPMGVFDIEKVKGDINLRYSLNGEKFLPLGSTSYESLNENILVLSDREKILSIFYHRDSVYQQISETTTAIMLLACKVPAVGAERISDAIEKGAEMIHQTSGGEIITE